jgi:ATP synthase protein I
MTVIDLQPLLPAAAAGLALGCLNAWHWVAKEDKAMREDEADDGD